MPSAMLLASIGNLNQFCPWRSRLGLVLDGLGQSGRGLAHRGGARAGRAHRPAMLSASELRVARLAAQGATNRAIAEELVVTPHTVRFHLANVYRKLQVGGRDEVAGALTRL